MNIFYHSHVQWFETFANGCIWAIIAAVVALIVWLAYDMIKGSELPEGFEVIPQISSHKAGKLKTTPVEAPVSAAPVSPAPVNYATDTTITTRSPFAPGNRRKSGKSGKANEQVKADLTAKS